MNNLQAKPAPENSAHNAHNGHSDAIHPNPELARRLQRIYALNKEAINLRLERSPYNVLLERLGNPHLDLPPTIHVAGTNGKGSTLAFLRQILQKAGYKVHQYTSPHLRIFNERIVLAGQEVDDATLIEALDHVDSINADNPVTFFEYTTALAFTLFSQQKSEADFLLLEVGMGGRLDCTNIIQSPICTAITKIGFDHQQYLGDTAALIASEKAGIIKDGVPCVVATQDFEAEVLPVFEAKAKQHGAKLIKSPLIDHNIELGLEGAHQYENAGTALGIIQVLMDQEYTITQNNIFEGLKQAQWRGRLEKVEAGTLFTRLQDLFGCSINVYIDGGHNVTAAKALKETLKYWKSKDPERPIYMMLGMGHDKDINGFVDIVHEEVDGFFVMDVLGGLHPQTAQETYAKLDDKYKAITHIWGDEVHHLPHAPEQDVDKAPIILICGSLFLYQLI